MSITVEYVQTPQDDLAQIEQIEREYSSDPAKGLAHGVQKDAIQNGFGARTQAKEADACKFWRFTFELIKISGEHALVFWDEGTHGLTGDIISANEINNRIGTPEMADPSQRLSRFLTRFSSGGNLGPGMFGRGKLVFHSASETSTIIVDSLRGDDGDYIAFDRRLEGSLLKQPLMPLQGSDAKQFLGENTGGTLIPLTAPGTRITILNVKEELVNALKYSFSDKPEVRAQSLAKMIEETWWEILGKFDAQVYLKYGDRSQRVGLTEPMKSILEAKDGADGVRVYEEGPINVIVQGERLRIKQLRLVVLPKPLPEDYNEIWVQRKRMKIGPVKRIDVNPKISKLMAGYVILEPDFEKLIEQAENPTHYSLNGQFSGVKKISEVVRTHLQKFEQKLGLGGATEDVESQRQLLSAMKDLNEMAQELGLVTQLGAGTQIKDLDIFLDRFDLPVAGTLRVELEDTIGPIEYTISNNRKVEMVGRFKLTAKQPGCEPHLLYDEELILVASGSHSVSFAGFQLDGAYESAKSLDVIAVFYEGASGKDLAQASRRIFVGLEPPVADEEPVHLSVSCRLPREGTRRVELLDTIASIRVRVVNNTPSDIKIDVRSSVRHLENRQTGRQTSPLFSLLESRDRLLKAQTELAFAIGDLHVSYDDFASVHEIVAKVSERVCDIFTVVALAEPSEGLAKPRHYKLCKRSILFYLEVDPPGNSVFQDADEEDSPTDGRQSWYSGDLLTGYRFTMNVGHSAYKFARGREDSAFITFYRQEQMLRQAYRIAFENEVYRGPAAEYELDLAGQSLTPVEASKIFDRIIGTAINELRGN